MSKQNILGIDMGGTNIRGGIVCENVLTGISSKKINATGSSEEIVNQLFSFIDSLVDTSVTSIGIGVPGLVTDDGKMLYDVINIPAWKEIPLKKIIEDKYNLPVHLENDANCFALGEFYFGKGKGYNSMIGLTIGTGLGSGIIINKKLFSGKNGGAGEFGMIDYLEHNYEYYASGQFFKNRYCTDGENVFKDAIEGKTEAIKMYEEMGIHLGNFVKMLLYSLDIELIVIGGSVRHAWPWFHKAMWKQVTTFAYQKTLKQLNIKVSNLKNAGILGAAALQYNFNL